MRRIAAAALLAAGVVTAHTSSAADPKTIAIVCHCRADFPTYKGFEERLAELGWRDGQTARLIRRFSDGDPSRLAKNAEEAVALKPDVIFAGFTPAVIAIRKHTSTLPVVFAGVSDAGDIGAASSLNRPENNFTGPITINRELMPKRLELLKEALPALTRIGYLANPGYGLHAPQLRDMQAAADRLGVKLVVAEAASAAQIEAAFDRLVSDGAQALVVQQDPLFTGQTKRVVALAQAKRLPAIYALRGFYEQGGFMWYGADIPPLFRRSAEYVDRILKGARPGDLPIERPTKFYLTINGRLAKQLGVEISPAVLARADEVTE